MAPQEPDVIQAELERRLTKLRTPPRPPNRTRRSTSGSQDIESRLASLDPPTEKEVEFDVLVETKNVNDEEVERFLYEASLAAPTLPPLSFSLASRKLNATRESYERLAPSFVSPIEVSFHTASSQIPSRTEEEDEALIARLQDELKVERKHGNAEAGEMGDLEKRLQGLKAFRTPLGSGSKTAVEVEKDGLGAAPTGVGISDFKLAGKGNDEDDSDSDSEVSEKSENDSDSDE